jgi:hypothetical protein
MRKNIFEALILDDPLYNGHFAAFSGAEGGFNERSDVLVQAADGTDLNAMWREIEQTLALRNTQRNTLLDILTFNVTREIETVSVPADVDFEEASEYGQPQGIRGGSKFHRGYDFKFYDLAVRYTWMFLAEADQAQLRNLNNMALAADTRLRFSKVMKTLFNPVNLTGFADGNIPVNVYKFYNNDGEVPPAFKNTTFSGTHNHFITSGGATVTSANIDTMANHLTEHGFGPVSGGRLVLMVNKAQTPTIKTFKVATGALYDFIPSSGYGGGVFIPANGGIIARPDGEVPGEVGTYGPFHIVEEDYIPAGYMVGLASGGDQSLENPIGIRQHANPAYQGLQIIPGARSDYPLMDSYYRRGFGTGVRQRGAGVVMQVTASGSYTTPAAYV